MELRAPEVCGGREWTLTPGPAGGLKPSFPAPDGGTAVLNCCRPRLALHRPAAPCLSGSAPPVSAPPHPPPVPASSQSPCALSSDLSFDSSDLVLLKSLLAGLSLPSRDGRADRGLDEEGEGEWTTGLCRERLQARPSPVAALGTVAGVPGRGTRISTEWGCSPPLGGKLAESPSVLLLSPYRPVVTCSHGQGH